MDNSEYIEQTDNIEEEKLDISNLITFIKNKDFKPVNLFSYDERILFVLLETKHTYLLIYIPSKFPLYYNHKTMKEFVAITSIKDDDDIRLNDRQKTVKRGFSNNLHYFNTSPLKQTLISNDVLLTINRHNEIEVYGLETMVSFDSIFWTIDLENFYSKIDTIDRDIKMISNNIIGNFYSKFSKNKDEAIMNLDSKLKELNTISKKLVPYDKCCNRLDNIYTKIAKEKNIEKKNQFETEFRSKVNSIENAYLSDLYYWDNFFAELKEL